MEKESVKKFDLEAAFKALDEIEIPQAKGIKANRVDLKERFSHKPATETLVEDYYDVSSVEDLEEAKDEREGEVAQAKLARIEKIVDLDAETAEDLLPSYVGKVIMQCPQCMTLFYKNPEDIEHSEENPDIVNLNEPCQHCGNTSGYTLIGKVDSVKEDEADKYEGEETSGEEENELDLDFEEPTEETSEESSEESGEDLDLDLDLDLEEVPEEEPEEEKKEESLNLSKETSENGTEHKSKNLTLNEDADPSKPVDDFIKDYYRDVNPQLTDYERLGSNDEKVILGGKVPDIKKPVINYFLDCSGSWEESGWKKEIEEIKNLKYLEDKDQARINIFYFSDHIYKTPEEARKSGHTSGVTEIVEYAKSHPEEKCIVRTDDDYKSQGGKELETLPNVELRLRDTNESLTEEVDKDLDKKLKEHNDYIEYLKKMIEQEEAALKACDNDEIKAAIQRRIDAFNADLEAALPDALKDLRDQSEEIPEVVEAREVVEEPVEEVQEEPVEEALVEETTENCKVVLGDEPEKEVFAGTKEECEKIIEKNKETETAKKHGLKLIEPTVEESLNKSEAAPSKDETENKSENLTLNEGAEAEIDSIIASWGLNESLTEKSDLDRLLDSDEFKTPVSKAEINAARADVKENLEECNKALTEEPEDQEVLNIIDSWSDETPVENTKAEEALEECGEQKVEEQPLKEDEEIPAEEESEPEEIEEPIADADAKADVQPDTEETPNVVFTDEEVKEVAAAAVEEVVEEAEVKVDAEVMAEKVDEVVANAVEEKIEEQAEEESPTEEDIENSEFNEEDIDELDECSLNKHIDEYLKEVYSNVKSYETTSCELKEGKLFVEGKISFNSGKEKLTMFEFLPNYCEGKLFFEGYNKDFSEDKAFTLNCSINESKTLITESFGYKYKINETLVEGLK